MSALAITAATGFATALLAVGVVRWYASRRSLLDHPNERSSHSVPTARGGGLGLLIGFAAALLIGLRSPSPLFGLAMGGIGLTALVGWLDDHGGLPVRTRLVVHLLAGASIAPLALGPSAGLAALGVLAVAWWVFCTVSAINVANFIDGIDGMLGTQATMFAVNLMLLARGLDAGAAAVFGAALLGASAGFLAWNWAPARIFLGDVGSGALGSAFIAGALLLAGGRPFVAVQALLPLLPILLDATLTLLRRAWRKERLTQAHRSHLYQRLANGGWGHARTTLAYGVVAASALPVAIVGQAAAMSVYAAVVVALYLIADRRPGTRITY